VGAQVAFALAAPTGAVRELGPMMRTLGILLLFWSAEHGGAHLCNAQGFHLAGMIQLTRSERIVADPEVTRKDLIRAGDKKAAEKPYSKEETSAGAKARA
jgi:hypothetical protein